MYGRHTTSGKLEKHNEKSSMKSATEIANHARLLVEELQSVTDFVRVFSDLSTQAGLGSVFPTLRVILAV